MGKCPFSCGSAKNTAEILKDADGLYLSQDFFRRRYYPAMACKRDCITGLVT